MLLLRAKENNIDQLVIRQSGEHNSSNLDTDAKTQTGSMLNYSSLSSSDHAKAYSGQNSCPHSVYDLKLYERKTVSRYLCCMHESFFSIQLPMPQQQEILIINNLHKRLVEYAATSHNEIKRSPMCIKVLMEVANVLTSEEE